MTPAIKSIEAERSISRKLGAIRVTRESCDGAGGQDSQPSEASTGLLLFTAGLLPFAAGAAANAGVGAESLPGTCLFRLATGLPCPFCGATRSFSFFSAGSWTFLSYNALWVFAALATVALGLLVMAGRVSLRGFWSQHGKLPIHLTLTLLLAGWIWALINHGAILTR